MKKFLQNILIFSFCFFVIDKLFYPLLIVSPSLEIDKRLEKVINGELDKDILIMGSSRGARNVIAKQIEDSLNMLTYNLSYPGSDIEFHEFLLKSIIEFNESPKLILLVVDDQAELKASNSIKFRFDRLYPLSKYKWINDEMIRRGEKSYLSNIFILAKINKSNFNLNKKKITRLDTITEHGSMPISFQRKNRDWKFNNSNSFYEEKNEILEKRNAFLSFQRLCANNNIRLGIVFSPNFKSYNSAFDDRIKVLSNKNTLFFRYDTLNKKYVDTAYYYDEAHLQKNGATMFTNEIIEQIKREEIQIHNEN